MFPLCQTEPKRNLQRRATNEAANDAMRKRCDAIETVRALHALRQGIRAPFQALGARHGQLTDPQ